jgi:hypothetical protein
MYEAESIKILIAYKWNKYGYPFHLLGCLIHCGNIVIFLLYNNIIYVDGLGVGESSE